MTKITNVAPKRVLVVGAGIAGPVLALLLQRAGFSPLLAEARARPEIDRGAFLTLSANGMNVLASVDPRLADEVRRAGFVWEGLAFQNARGEPIGAIDRRADEQAFGASGIIVKRAALHAILLEAATRAGVAIRFDARLVSVENARGEGPVIAALANGETVQADLLVGCDGLHSMVRKLVFTNAPAPRFTGLLDSGGFARTPPGLVAGGPMTMVFGRRAFFGMYVASPEETFWFSNLALGSREEPPRAVRDEASLADVRDRLLAQHEGDPPFVRAILTSDLPLGLWPTYDLPPLPTWHVGKVCLLGDAAHATSPHIGQGASLALEDAQVLARLLAQLPAEDAFVRFTRERRPRVERLVHEARRMGSRKAPSSALACWFRDRSLPFFLRLGAKSMDWVYAYRAEEAVPLEGR